MTERSALIDKYRNYSDKPLIEKRKHDEPSDQDPDVRYPSPIGSKKHMKETPQSRVKPDLDGEDFIPLEDKKTRLDITVEEKKEDFP